MLNKILSIFRRFSYDTKPDFLYNEKLLQKLGYSKDLIKKKLKINNIDYYSEELSWHYHIFSGIKKKKLKILEIGTFTAEFSLFLSKIFPSSKIITIDLKTNDKKFINEYNRDGATFRKKFLNKRNKNLKRKNINFYTMDSFDLIHKFKKNYFDLIWIDGDHLNPQVTIDIFSSFSFGDSFFLSFFISILLFF